MTLAALAARSVLTPRQATVADRVLGEETAARSHLVIALSGAHAYGFPSPDSDLDLKAVHVEPTARLLGLSPPPPAASRVETLDGVEIDYSSNEVGPVIAGLIAGNGNYFERILGRLQCFAPPAELAELQSLARAALSRRIHRHYSGFAHNQLAAVDAATPTGVPAKRVLYVLRTALTGLHALRAGAIVPDLNEHIDHHALADARTLIEAKRSGELSLLPPASADFVRQGCQRDATSSSRSANGGMRARASVTTPATTQRSPSRR